MTAPRLEVIHLGRQPYQEVLELQRSLREERLSGERLHDMLLLVEHPSVYTLGRGTLESSLPVSQESLRATGAEVIEIERGGDVTWHGPGQLVAYPIIDLRQHRQDLHWYLRTLERALIGTLADVGLAATTVPGKTGVWVEQRKIASIGIHVRQWVTLHGVAINVDPDLTWFGGIVPCGLHGVTMTSVATELGVAGVQHDLMSRVERALVMALSAELRLEPSGMVERSASTEAAGSVKACDSTAARSTFTPYG